MSLNVKSESHIECGKISYVCINIDRKKTGYTYMYTTKTSGLNNRILTLQIIFKKINIKPRFASITYFLFINCVSMNSNKYFFRFSTRENAEISKKRITKFLFKMHLRPICLRFLCHTNHQILKQIQWQIIRNFVLFHSLSL